MKRRPGQTLLSISVGAVLAATAAVPQAQAAPYTLVHTVTNPTFGDDQFGWAVDVAGGTAIAGAQLDDVGGLVNVGSANLIDTVTGVVTHTLVNPNLDANNSDAFGHSVAIDGGLAVVGAYLADGVSVDQGEAYVYDTTTGALLSTLVNPDAAISDLGYFADSVDISGGKVVVGARNNDPGGLSNAGSAYVFDALTGSLLNTLINPLESITDEFGFSVAIDDNLIAVGARLEDTGGLNSGAVYVYDATTGGLVSSILNPTADAGDFFGWSVDIDDGMVLVGSPFDDSTATDGGQAYLFDALTGSLLETFGNPDPTADDRFGSSVDLSGTVAAVGAYRDDPGGVDDAGSAYLFNAVSGGLMQSITDPTPFFGDFLGGQRRDGLAVDGGTLVVGLYSDNTSGANAGAVNIYSTTTGVPAPGALAVLGSGLFGLGLRRRKS